MVLSFQQKIQIEQLRAVEEACGTSAVALGPGLNESFEAWLVRRSEALTQQEDLAAALHQGPHWYRIVLAVMLVMLALLGMSTAFQAVTGGTDVLNIFWILAVLLGFNWLALLLWVVLTFLLRRQGGGVLAPLISAALHGALKLARLPPAQQAASRIWLGHQFAPPHGKWHLSQLVHLGWLSFLAGGFVCLLLLLATRQFDFVWASTLLDGQTFVRLTEALAAPLQTMHWPTPTDAQILASQQRGSLPDPAGARRAWALFLLGCLLLYGFVPRLLVWSLCKWQRHRLSRRWLLPLSDPYYLRLQQQFWPQSSAAQVLDADSDGGPSQPEIRPQAPLAIPEGALWFGLELSAPLLEQMPNTLFQVGDSTTLEAATQKVRTASRSPVAIAVNGDKPADRGLRRALQQLTARRPGQCWMVILTREQEPQHLQSWRQAALSCALSAERVVEQEL